MQFRGKFTKIFDYTPHHTISKKKTKKKTAYIYSSMKSFWWHLNSNNIKFDKYSV